MGFELNRFSLLDLLFSVKYFVSEHHAFGFGEARRLPPRRILGSSGSLGRQLVGHLPGVPPTALWR